MNESVPPVALAALNYRMGGQLSSLMALADGLQAVGVDARVLLPDGVEDFSKESLIAFSRKPLLTRLNALRRMLAMQSGRQNEILHLMLPTPGFAFVARLLGLRMERTVLQWEGRPLALNRESLSAFMSDPIFLLPRLLLNHQCLRVIARRCNFHQLVTTQVFAKWLERRGHQRVACIANWSTLTRDDLDDPSGELSAFLSDPLPLIGYLGHAHPVKGVRDLLDAFRRAQATRPELRLLLALSADGNGESVLHRVQSFPPATRARILIAGTVPVGRVLARLEALALPYRSIISTTLIPSLLLEADAAECPVILSDLPDYADIVPRDGNGWHLVPPGNIDALTEAMITLPARHRPTPLKTSPPASRLEELMNLYRNVAKAAWPETHG